MIVFDASGSMAGNTVQGLFSDVTRIDEVRKALAQVLPAATKFRKVGLITYGPGPYGQCNVALDFRPMPNAAAPIMSVVNALNPAGKTPLVKAVELAAEVLDYRSTQGVVVLLTDGEETCGGAPCDLGKAIKANGRLTVHVIGYQLRAFRWTGAQSFLDAKCLAEETGGLYITAENSEDLVEAFEKTLGCPMMRNKGGWGYYDSALFDYAYLKFIQLQRGGKPFHMVLFTQDTHDGDFDTTRCGGSEQPYVGLGKDNKIVQAVRCADTLLGEFIHKISEEDRFADTILVLVGDHIMHERLIHIRKNPDAVFGLVLNGGIRKVHEGTSTHMDVAPTVLALAGIKTNAKFLDGKDLLGNSQPARNINLASLPKEVLDEFGLLRAPDYAQRGIIYKHTSSDAYEYIRANEIPFQERDGIRAYHIETLSYNWRNILVFLESKDCVTLEGKPFAMYSDQDGGPVRFDFTGVEADTHAFDGRCGRLLSFYVSYKSNSKTLRVGINKRHKLKWEASLIP